MRLSTLVIFSAALCLAGPAFADSDASLEQAIAHVAQRWDEITYDTHDTDREEKEMAALVDDADKVVAAHPAAAEPLVWSAIARYSLASYINGFKGYELVRDARDRLEKALTIDPMNSAALANLGFIYYQVPGFPLAFGSHKKAQAYLEKALSITPDDIDANYFYGDFLFQRGDYRKARSVLEHGLKALPRPGRVIGDKGRRDDIEVLLAQIDRKLGGPS